MATTTECDPAVVRPTTFTNLSDIANAIIKSTHLSAQLLAPLPSTASSMTELSSNSSPSNSTFIWPTMDLFAVPFEHSGHTWLHIILTTILIVSIMVVIIFGNALVIIAVQVDRSLKGIQNYFIVSLAFADLLVGLTVMPLSLVVELMGKWIFGQIACNLWLGGDVSFFLIT